MKTGNFFDVGMAHSVIKEKTKNFSQTVAYYWHAQHAYSVFVLLVSCYKYYSIRTDLF